MSERDPEDDSNDGGDDVHDGGDDGAGPGDGESGPRDSRAGPGDGGADPGDDGAVDGDGADPDSGDRTGSRTAGPGVGALDEGWVRGEAEDDERGPDPAPDVGQMAAELREVRDRLESFETDVDDRTVHRSEIESELRRYVRWKLRRGHARGWGPYLVLLYGTAMTLGAFYYLQGLWSILAMLVVWTSTLGVYVLMVLAGAGFNLLGLPMWALDKVGRLRGN